MRAAGAGAAAATAVFAARAAVAGAAVPLPVGMGARGARGAGPKGSVWRALLATPGAMTRGGPEASDGTVLGVRAAACAAPGAVLVVRAATGALAVGRAAVSGFGAAARAGGSAALAVEVPAIVSETSIGALQFRHGTLPPLLASARATSSPMATIVEQTLHRICIAPCGPLSRRSRPLNLPAQMPPRLAQMLLRPYVQSTLKHYWVRYCNRIDEIGDSNP